MALGVADAFLLDLDGHFRRVGLGLRQLDKSPFELVRRLPSTPDGICRTTQRQRVAMISKMQKAIREVSKTAAENTLPDDLEKRLRRRLEQRPELPWDIALLDLMGGDISNTEPGNEEDVDDNRSVHLRLRPARPPAAWQPERCDMSRMRSYAQGDKPPEADAEIMAPAR